MVDTYIYSGEIDYFEQLKHYRTVPTEGLVAILEEQNHYTEFHAVLDILYERKPHKAIKLAKAMLEDSDGDKWNGAWTIAELLRFVGNRDYRYALEYLKKNIDTMESPVLEAVLDCLDGYYGKTIDKNLLQKITKAYNSYEEDDRKCVYYYKLLMESLNKQEYKRLLRKFSRKNRLKEMVLSIKTGLLIEDIDMWFKVNGQSLDGGILIKAEEGGGAGITLERDSIMGAFSTTFGIYGLGFHTVVYPTLKLALKDYDKMKHEFQNCVETAERTFGKDVDAYNDRVIEWFTGFVERH